jgi:hypothetical protein
VQRRLVSAVAVVGLLGSVGTAFAGTSSTRHREIAPKPLVRSAQGNVADSLPRVASGHRPGPSVLYAKPAVAPQLENRGIWKAPPTLVSGTEAYRDGEWMYQDYLYDDHGAFGVLDPTTPWGETDYIFSPVAGTYTYPTARKYADNAADLVEFRTKPLPSATAFRVTLNSLTDPSLVGFTITLGTSENPQEWPAGAGVTSSAAYFVTVHGHSATMTQAGTGRVLKPVPTVAVSVHRRQFTVEVPHAAWNPGKSTVRMSVGVGLWDRTHHRYELPALGPATAARPGGGGATPIALVNIGPRLNEPWPSLAQPTETIADSAVGELVQPFMWREHEQAYELGVLGSAEPFFANVDFARLAHHVTDLGDIPRSGTTDRIFASHFSFGQGLDPSQVCSRIVPPAGVGARCKGRMVGQLQPYNLYVPKVPAPSGGYGMTLLLHSLTGNYNQYATSHNQSQLGRRGTGSIVLTPGGRGPDGGYAGVAEADTFEAWNAVAHLYPLNPDWTAISGYSMGGFGTYRLAERYPDLFARAFSVVGEASPASGLPSLRNVPILAWNATADELVPVDGTVENTQQMTAAGLRYIEQLYTAADHLTLATNDQYGPGAIWLGTHRVNRNPAHVTFVVNHAEDNVAAHVIADHAYWLSKVTPRRAGATGTIDVRSLAFGAGDPTPSGMKVGAGALTGGTKAAIPYVEFSQAWGKSPKTPKRDALDVVARNIARVVVDVHRARIDCHAKVHVNSDGPVRVVLGGCGRTVTRR